MNGFAVLVLVICIAALPIVIVHIWLRITKFPLSTPHFLLALLAGALSLVFALILQMIFTDLGYPRTKLEFLAEVFIRIALTEELGRFLALFLFFILANVVIKEEAQCVPIKTAFGLIAGLGFAFVESASYGASDIHNAVLRAFTTAPLHGACGARIGMAFAFSNTKLFKAFVYFISAVGLHGMYNLMAVSSGAARVIAVLLGATAFIAAIQVIRRGV